MTREFVGAFLTRFVLAATVLGAIGAGAAYYFTPSPPSRLITPTFEMTLADGWSCGRSGLEYICRKGEPPSDAIAIIAIKLRGAADTLEAYEAHLSAPIAAESKGEALVSEPLTVKRTELRGHTWIEALHFQSEVRNFFTYYFATATRDSGALVTFSVHKDFRAKVDPEILPMMRSLIIHQRP